jgi:mitofilin
MMRGDPIEKEVQLLLQSSGGFGHDALVDAALISLPEDAIKEGTWTHPQLHSKFVSLQQSLRELGMIPAGGGGMFTHLIARTASSLKVWKESCQ